MEAPSLTPTGVLSMVRVFVLFLLLPIAVFATELDLSKIRDPKTFSDKVKKGFDANATRSSDGYSLMHFAAETGSVELFETLVSQGADKNKPKHDGETPLATAIRYDKKDIIRMLLELGVDPNYRLGDSMYRRTHFHFYVAEVKKFDRYIFETFLRKQADLNTRDSLGETPFLSSVKNEIGNEMFPHFLTLRVDMKVKDKKGKNALMLASFSEGQLMIKTLLRSNFSPEEKDQDGNTALLSYVQRDTAGKDERKVEAIKVLMDVGANVYATNQNGNTILHEAVRTNSPLVLQYLTTQNINFNVFNIKQLKALDQAVAESNWKAVKILLAVEKDINAVDLEGSTRLHKAVGNKQLEYARLLLEFGADPLIPNQNGLTAKGLAESLKDPEMISLFQTAN